MSKYDFSNAFLVGGFSEDHDFLETFAIDATTGPNAFVGKIEPITWAEAHKAGEKFKAEARHRAVIAHSGASLLVHESGAKVIMSLNGVEPTPLLGSIKGAAKSGGNKNLHAEPHVTPTSLTNGLMEVVKHPSNLRIPFAIRKFSTVQMLIDGGTDAFPGGRLYLPTDGDEFGFGQHGEVERARANGIDAHMLNGYHNSALLRPLETLVQINEVLEPRN